MLEMLDDDTKIESIRFYDNHNEEVAQVTEHFTVGELKKAFKFLFKEREPKGMRGMKVLRLMYALARRDLGKTKADVLLEGWCKEFCIDRDIFVQSVINL